MDRGSDIRRLREAARLEAQHVAERVGITAPYLSLLETGKRPLSLDLYARILKAIDELRSEQEVRWQAALATVGTGDGDGGNTDEERAA